MYVCDWGGSESRCKRPHAYLVYFGYHDVERDDMHQIIVNVMISWQEIRNYFGHIRMLIAVLQSYELYVHT